MELKDVLNFFEARVEPHIGEKGRKTSGGLGSSSTSYALRDEITKVNNNFKLVNPTCLLTVLTI
jgi:hypothetical protein